VEVEAEEALVEVEAEEALVELELEDEGADAADVVGGVLLAGAGVPVVDGPELLQPARASAPQSPNVVMSLLFMFPPRRSARTTSLMSRGTVPDL